MNGRYFVSHDYSAYGAPWGLYITSNGGRLQFWIKSASGQSYATTADLGTGYYADNAWHTMVGIYDKALGSNRVNLYADAVLQTPGAGYNEDITAGDEGIDIGRWNNAPNGLVTGSIAEIVFVNTAQGLGLASSYHYATTKPLVGESGGFWKEGTAESRIFSHTMIWS